MGRTKPLGEKQVNGGTFVRFSDDEWQKIDRIRQSVFDATGFVVSVSDVIKKLIRDYKDGVGK